MSQIKITTLGNTTTLESPYHPDLPQAAKKLGGKFDRASRTWKFDARDEQLVRDTILSIYGTDGSDADDTVTVRVRVAEGYKWSSEACEALYLGGQQIARAYGRDSGAKLGEGVVLIEGRAMSGGSAKNWRTRIDERSVVEVRDVPRGVASKMLDEARNVEDIEAAEIVDEAVDRQAALRAERERLVARLSEIDAELSQ